MAVQNSINTNVGSFVALCNLNSINRKLDVTQNRVSTGLKVAGALDDASNFSIAQGIRGELKAIGAVPQGQRGRASWRERVCTYVSISVGAVSLKKKTHQS